MFYSPDLLRITIPGEKPFFAKVAKTKCFGAILFVYKTSWRGKALNKTNVIIRIILRDYLIGTIKIEKIR